MIDIIFLRCKQITYQLMAITTAKLTSNDRLMNMTKFYSVNFTSASAGASIPQAQLHLEYQTFPCTQSHQG